MVGLQRIAYVFLGDVDVEDFTEGWTRMGSCHVNNTHKLFGFGED